MVGGFNHNFKYRGHMYHVQTEDSGVARAHVTTLLYRGGSIIAREVEDYHDISSAPDLVAQVELMMKDQHRTMLQKLKDGAFDARIDQLDAGETGHTELTQAEVVSMPAREEELVAQEESVVAQAEPDRCTDKLDNMVRTYLDAGR